MILKALAVLTSLSILLILNNLKIVTTVPIRASILAYSKPNPIVVMRITTKSKILKES